MNLERFLGPMAAFAPPASTKAELWTAAKAAAEALVAAEKAALTAADEGDAKAAAREARQVAEMAIAAFDADQTRLRDLAASDPARHTTMVRNGVVFELTAEEVVRLEAADEESGAADFTRCQAEAMAAIDAAANAVRGRYITNTEALVYQLKREEAARFAADAGVGAFPMIAGEARRQGVEQAAVAKQWNEQAVAWGELASLIDGPRLTAKAAVRDAVDMVGVKAAQAAQRAAYDVLPPAD